MIEELLGIDSDFIIMALTLISVILFVMMIIILIRLLNLEKNYDIFMTGKSARNLEEVLTTRLNQVDDLIEKSSANEATTNRVASMMGNTFQKMGLVRYNALNEMGGKLSFSLALLNEKNDGFVLNAVHSREGCFTYIKDIIGGHSVAALAKEEKEALAIAIEGEKKVAAKKAAKKAVKKAEKKAERDAE